MPHAVAFNAENIANSLVNSNALNQGLDDVGGVDQDPVHGFQVAHDDELLGLSFVINGHADGNDGTLTISVFVNGVDAGTAYDTVLTLADAESTHRSSRTKFTTPLALNAEDILTFRLTTTGWNATTADIAVYPLLGKSYIGSWCAANIANSQTNADLFELTKDTSATIRAFRVARDNTITGITLGIAGVNSGNDGTLTVSVFVNGIDSGTSYDLSFTLVDSVAGEFHFSAEYGTPLAVVAGDLISLRCTTTGWNTTTADVAVNLALSDNHYYLGSWAALNVANSLSNSDTLFLWQSTNVVRKICPVDEVIVTGMTIALDPVTGGQVGTLVVKIFAGEEETGTIGTFVLPGTAGPLTFHTTFGTPLSIPRGVLISLRISTSGWTATSSDLIAWLECTDDPGGEGNPPVISNITPTPPPPETLIERLQPFGFDITDNSSLIQLLVLVWHDINKPPEVAYDLALEDAAGNGFWPTYTEHSSVENIANGKRFSILKKGGWLSNPEFKIYAVDEFGNVLNT
jgi:hypothetical protein